MLKWKVILRLRNGTEYVTFVLGENDRRNLEIMIGHKDYTWLKIDPNDPKAASTWIKNEEIVTISWIPEGVVK